MSTPFKSWISAVFGVEKQIQVEFIHLATLKDQYRWYVWPVATLLAILGLFGVILCTLHNPVAIDESLRHIAMAKLMATNGIRNAGGWGQFFYHGYFTIHDSDPWFLYHTLLVPLTPLPTPLLQKIIILVTALFLGSVYIWICKWLQLQSRTTAVLVAILMLGNMQFLLRLFLARPGMLLAAISILCYALMTQKRWELLFVTLVVTTLLSHLFVFPLLVALAGVLWRWTTFQDGEGFFVLLVALLAVGLGIWLHPQSTEYWHYLCTVFTKLPFLLQLDVGTEMMTGFGREATLLAMVGVIAFGFLAGLVNHNISLQQYHRKGTTLLLTIVGAMLLGFFVWVRIIDFLWPFCLVLLASLISIQPYLISKTLPELLPKSVRHTHVYLVIFMLILGTHTGKLFYTHWQEDADKSLQGVYTALYSLQPGANVLNVDWDLFPALVLMRPDLHYARGMDPGFNYLVDNRVGALFRYIDTNSPDIWFRQAKEVFAGTDAIVLRSNRHPKLLEFFRSTEGLDSVYPQTEIATFLLQ